MEDDGTRMLFVAVRRSLSRIAGDAGLLAEVAWRLQAEGRARLLRRLKTFSFSTRVGGRSYWFSRETMIFSDTLLRFFVNFVVLFTSF